MHKHPLVQMVAFFSLVIAMAFTAGRGVFATDLAYRILFDLVVVFNILCMMLAPFLLDRKSTIRFLNRIKGPDWNLVRGLAWIYIATWLIFTLPLVLFILGMKGPLQMGLEEVTVWNLFHLTYADSDMLFFIGLFGVLGLKGAMLLDKIAGILVRGPIVMDVMGQWGSEDDL